MTFCLGMKVQEGLVAIADTRVISGHECITARKMWVHQAEGQSMFVMSSGLRSVRDKVLTYFQESMEEHEMKFDRLFKAVNSLAVQIRTVAREDKEALSASGLNFNLHCLIGGQMSKDKEHHLYLVYPEGNWVEVQAGTPYSIIGAQGYGKPVLDRTFKYQDSMQLALKIGCLAFDSTRISAVDVDLPMDVCLYRAGSFQMVEHRLEKADLTELITWWQERLRQSVSELPSQVLDSLFKRMPAAG